MHGQRDDLIQLLKSEDDELVDELFQNHPEDAVSTLNCADHPVRFSRAVVHLDAKRFKSSLAITPE